LPSLLYSLAYSVYFFLWKKELWLIEPGAITRELSMPVVKITIGTDVKVCTLTDEIT